MSKQIYTKAHRQIDIFIAIQIPDFRPVCTLGYNLIHHFLQNRPETSHITVIGVYGAILLGVLFGATRTGRVALNQLLQVLFLTGESNSRALTSSFL